MRYFFFTLLLAASFSAGAQTIKIKDGTVWVDNKEYVYITDETATISMLSSIETDSDLVYLTLVDPTPGASSDFDDRYYLIRFPDFDREAVLQDFRKVSVLKFIVSHGLIEDGHINKLNFESFIAKYGTVEEK
eukprot:gene5878-7301_t